MWNAHILTQIYNVECTMQCTLHSTRKSKILVHSAVSIGNNIFPLGIMKLQYCSTGDWYFQIRTTNLVPWICCFSFPKYIFGISFWDHEIQTSIRQMNVQHIFPNYEKLKSFVETFSPHKQILIFFQGPFMYAHCPICIFIFDTDQT